MGARPVRDPGAYITVFVERNIGIRHQVTAVIAPSRAEA